MPHGSKRDVPAGSPTIEDIQRKRRYYAGRQYGALNATVAKNLGVPVQGEGLKRLKEHQRAHAYSTHIQEGIDFLADQITGQMIRQAVRPEDDTEIEGFTTEAADRVDLFLDELWSVSILDERNQEVAREILVAGNLACELVPDFTVAEASDVGLRFQFWQTPEEAVLTYSSFDWSDLVMVEVWTEEGDQDVVRRYEMVFHPEDIRGECLVFTFEQGGYDTDQQILLGTRRTGLPFIPFVHLHGENDGLRNFYGKSMVSDQLTETADRYNATKQLEFLAVRYNAFSTLAITGDAVHLQNTDDNSVSVIRKDIGEFITFPGGSDLHELSLPTDTDLISSQIETLVDSMWGLLGLEDLSPEKISSFGGVSGYALEILNRKTDGSFRRIVQNLKEGYRAMVEMAFDVDAYARAELLEPVELDDGSFVQLRAFWLIKPEEIWTYRMVRIDFGTAYIIDEVAVRDDFIARIISQDEALRQKGYTNIEIGQILAEQEEANNAQNEEATLSQGTRFATNRA